MAKAALLIVAVVLCVAVSHIEAAKVCPAVKPGQVGTCQVECDFGLSRSSKRSKFGWYRRGCPSGKICCSNGCGRVCVNGVEDTPAGVCPASSGLAGICIFRPGVNCLSDDECASKGQLCCSEGCGSVCKDPVPPPPPAGVCPPSSGLAGICIFGPNNCLSDEECGQGKLCCSEGCGSVCKDPVPPPPPPAGVCPPSSGLPGLCVFGPNNCLSDEECGQGKLCCSEGCGKVCKDAVKQKY